MTSSGRVLVALFLVYGVALNLVIRALTHVPTGLSYARMWLGVGSDTRPWHDSWAPMLAALRHLAEQPTQSVYEALFFEQHIKFQYPPTSLLPLRLLETLGVPATPASLDAISWPMVFATALVLMALFRMSARPSFARTAPARTWWVPTLEAVAIIGLALTSYPIVSAYMLGQMQTWVTLLSVCMLLAWVSGWKGLAGALCALMAAIKPQWAFLLVWAMLRREWRFATFLAGTSTAVALLSVAVFGLRSHLDYPSVLGMLAERGENLYTNQSINGLLNRWTWNGGDWRNGVGFLAPYNSIVSIGTSASSLVILAMAAFFRRRDYERAPTADLMIAALSLTIASPVAWPHHYGIMLAILVISIPAIVITSSRGRTAVVWLLCIAYAMANITYDLPVADRFARAPWNLLYAHGLFGGLLMLGCLYWFRSQMGRTARDPTARFATERAL